MFPVASALCNERWINTDVAFDIVRSQKQVRINSKLNLSTLNNTKIKRTALHWLETIPIRDEIQLRMGFCRDVPAGRACRNTRRRWKQVRNLGEMIIGKMNSENCGK
jgi:hypothetical protein